MKNLIVDLPRNLSAVILSDFLSIKDVGKLDSAICKVKLREPFLELLSCTEFTIDHNDISQFSFTFKIIDFEVICNLRWHVARSVKIRCVYLTEELKGVDEAEIVQFMSVTNRHAEELTVHRLSIARWIHSSQLRFDHLKSLTWVKIPNHERELAEVLRRSPNLEELTLYDDYTFDGRCLHDVIMVSVLRIFLKGSFGGSDMTFLGQLCPNVSSLNINVPRFSFFKNPAGVASLFRQLRTLVINDPTNMKDADLIRIVDGCPQLKHIDLRHASVLTDYSVTYMCNNCTQLESIELAKAYNITSASLQAMERSLSATLRNLELSRCEAIESFAALLACRRLEFLNLSTERTQYPVYLKDLRTSCPALRLVDIRYNVMVGESLQWMQIKWEKSVEA